jgi:hypothetical protein
MSNTSPFSRGHILPDRIAPAPGLEALEEMGIDIDQDPRAFARFLEISKRYCTLRLAGSMRVSSGMTRRPAR